MATLSASRRNSANSTPNTPRPSLTGGTVNSPIMSRISGLNVENNSLVENHFHSLTLEDTVPEVDQSEEENSSNQSEEDRRDEEEEEINVKADEVDEIQGNSLENMTTIDTNGNYEIKEKKIKNESDSDETQQVEEVYKDRSSKQSPKSVKGRSCTERSDSGISCSSHLTTSSCTSTPLLGKKFSIIEEPELRRHNLADSNESLNYTSSKLLTLSSKFESRENLTNRLPSEENLRSAVRCKGVNINLEDKIETFEHGEYENYFMMSRKTPKCGPKEFKEKANIVIVSGNCAIDFFF